MRLLIRPEQMSAIQQTAEEKFVRRLADHLLEKYPNSTVKLPDEKSTVAGLPEETLHALVTNSISRARSHGLNQESPIAAFSALMFDVAPNFDKHKLSQVLLNDETLEPNARLDELLEVLTEKNWDNIRSSYDPQEWYAEPQVPAEAEESKPEGEK